MGNEKWRIVQTEKKKSYYGTQEQPNNSNDNWNSVMKKENRNEAKRNRLKRIKQTNCKLRGDCAKAETKSGDPNWGSQKCICEMIYALKLVYEKWLPVLLTVG